MTVTRYAIQRATDDGPFHAYNEADGSLIGIDQDPARAFAKLQRKVYLRDKMEALPVGARMQFYEGMGNVSFGIVTGRLNADGRLGVKFDGTVSPEGVRHEPYESFAAIDGISPDPNGDNARADVARWNPGFMRIEATI